MTIAKKVAMLPACVGDIIKMTTMLEKFLHFPCFCQDCILSGQSNVKDPEPTSDELVSASAEACGRSTHPSTLHFYARPKMTIVCLSLL